MKNLVGLKKKILKNNFSIIITLEYNSTNFIYIKEKLLK